MSQLALYTVHARRPVSASADPAAGPGGADYRSEVPPDSHYDCVPLRSFFKTVDLAKLKNCMSAVEEPVKVFFSLRRDATPSLQLEEGDLPVPVLECFKSVLPMIPLPREIFYLSRLENREDLVQPVSCFSSRLDLNADKLQGLKMPMRGYRIRLDLPQEHPPQTDEETFRLLESLSITPFFESGRKTLRARIVPDAICARCMGERWMAKPGDPPLVLWPE